MTPAILITQCLQNDFVKLIGSYDPLPNSLHVGYSEAERLLGSRVEEGPVLTVMDWAYRQDPQDLAIINIRDWHQEADPSQASHLSMFGSHCLKDSPGAEFVFAPVIRPDRPQTVVNASGLNDFRNTELEAVLAPYASFPAVHVGILGVWTEAKVYYLAYELATRYPGFRLAVCSALCASSSRHRHFQALDQMRDLLGVRVYDSVGEFTRFLTGTQPDFHIARSSRLDISKMKFSGELVLKDGDKELLPYLFRDSRQVQLKALDGGFSGNLVLKAVSEDSLGHREVPYVVKIGPRGLIAKERSSFEKIQEVLGNNAPAVNDFAEWGDRGAIKYRYAAMSEGAVTCFQDLYEGQAPQSTIRQVLDRVFVEQLGRLYQAASFEKLNLFVSYEFSPSLAPGLEKNVRAILGLDATADLGQEIAPGILARDLISFYREDVPALLQGSGEQHYLSYVHGDLNGKNVLIDPQGNVWIIDFFNCCQAPVLKDLAKMENDLLFIFTKVDTEDDLSQGKQFLDVVFSLGDLGRPPVAADFPGIVSPAWLRARDTLCQLRGYYPGLVQLDRDPLQSHVAMLRYAAHTLSFSECSPLQKRLALYCCGRAVEKIRAARARAQDLVIDFISTGDQRGQLGLTILPGRRDRNRDLDRDIGQIRAQGVRAVLVLLSEDEYVRYGVGDLRDQYRRSGLEVLSLPILDQSVPGTQALSGVLDWVEGHISRGDNVLVHCVGGLGRSGLLAAAWLMESCGFTAEDAIAEVRRVRGPRAVESKAQEDFLHGYQIANTRDLG